MSEKRYDLEERTFNFAKDITLYCKGFPTTVSNIEYRKQLIRSAGSVGANYIEANESLSRKDFLLRLKICRKEAKESMYWIRLLMATNAVSGEQRGERLLDEATELKKIFSAIIEKTTP